MNLWESGGNGWTVYEHLCRKTHGGQCGLDLLSEQGVGYLVGEKGDIEISIDGHTDNPQKSILYILEPPTLIPELYREKYPNPNFLGRFTAIENKKEYYEDILGLFLENTYKSQVCGIYDYKTEWENKEKFMSVFTKMKHAYNDIQSRYGIYELRRPVIEFAANRYADRFDFYGDTDGEISNYRGGVYDDRRYDYPKMDCISKYKFTLCFENSKVPGYITEKMLHALNARTIPVYFGSPNILEYIDDNVFINYDRFSSLEECFGYIDSMSESEINNMISRIDAFVRNDEKTHKTSSIKLAESILTCLDMAGISK